MGGMAKHVIGIRNDGWEFRNKLNALPHQIIAGSALYTSSEIGLGGIANQLNLQGIRKIPRQNGTLEDWTGHFISVEKTPTSASGE